MELKKINCGCGFDIKKGYFNVDSKSFPGIDQVFYAGKDKFNLPDNSVSEILCYNLLEHLGWSDTEDYLVNFIEECYRVVDPNGVMRITVPHFPAETAFIHPEHRRFFTRNSFAFYQVPAGNYDPHGYLTGFWHVNILPETDEDMLYVEMRPNKKGNKMFNYKEIKRKNES